MPRSGPGKRLKRLLHEQTPYAIDEALDRIHEQIRRHTMGQPRWRVEIRRVEDAPHVPPDWPVQHITLLIYAKNADHASEIAADIIDYIQNGQGILRALFIDSIEQIV